ncbi:Extracellular metalloprotease [Colletotrichum fructicola]|nr:Extracellular metalloprotease [Colletotrichum fructicola]
MLTSVVISTALLAMFQPVMASCDCSLRVESHISPGFSLDVVSTLIIGSQAAAIVDLPLAVSAAEDLAAWVKNTTDKPLLAAFTTHNHPDHYLSGKAFLQHFPDAKHYATPETTEFWSAAYGPGVIAPIPAIPTAYNFSFFTLPGDEKCPIEILKNVGGDTIDLSAFWIPSSKTLIAGDVVYGHQMHAWLADLLTPALTESWLTTLDFIAGLGPNLVIPGHALSADTFSAIVDVNHTHEYVSFFQKNIEAKGADFYTPQEISKLIDDAFPGLTNLTSSTTSATLLNITSENFGRGGERQVHYFDLTFYNDTEILDGWRLSGAGAGAGVATASPSSPNLATTVSFSAQPSDGFSNVNQSVVEKMPESETPTPPDASTPEQFNAELTANVPEKAISQKNAKALAILETAYFEYFVNKDPAPVDMGRIAIPASISQCQTQYARSLVKRRGIVDEVLSYVPLLSRDLRGFENCKAVESLEVGVYFHYMRATSTADRPNELESRVKAQVDVLNEALGAIKINFRYMSLNWWEPKTGEDWSVVTRREAKLQDWQQRTRAPGKLTLTVWLVNGLRGSQNDDLNSYATFPNENLDANDGIVIEAAHVQGGDSTTLVHDVGHWLGLGHTFGDIGTQCASQDGLTNATQTSGMKDVVYECSQVPCSGGSAVEINNYMSYSSCRGKTPQDGFTTDQKARMFANALQFRRGYEAGECMPDGKAAMRKRSSMQDLLDGKCPDVDKQANILMDAPHSLSARAHGLSKMGWAVLAGWWAATLVM